MNRYGVGDIPLGNILSIYVPQGPKAPFERY